MMWLHNCPRCGRWSWRFCAGQRKPVCQHDYHDAKDCGVCGECRTGT